MMIKLIADSSADTFALDGVCFASAALSIHAGEHFFLDDENLNTSEMMDHMAAHKGKSGTACPSPESWLNAFEGADEIYVVTMTSQLSGTYGSAMVARDIYLQTHPEAKIHVFDTLTTGPEMRLLLEKIAEWIGEGREFEEICRAGEEYMSSTHLLFYLESLHNLAQNGRVSMLAASAIGILGIRILAKASAEGTIETIEKCRGEKKAQSALVQQMLKAGYCGGKVRISHAENPAAALHLQVELHSRFPQADIKVYPCGGLCSYYAERGGILVGFETDASAAELPQR